MEFTELDNKAWELFLKATPNSVVTNQSYFVHHKKSIPYNKYYKDAKLVLRKQKLEKICSNMVIK